jgi:hypothetical protein
MYTNERLLEEDEEVIETYLARLNGRAWGIAIGLVLGLGLFAATIILVLKGGPVVGPRLALLGQYFPGYSVTVSGSFIGFVYGFFLGFCAGRLFCWCYNAVASRTV